MMNKLSIFALCSMASARMLLNEEALGRHDGQEELKLAHDILPNNDDVTTVNGFWSKYNMSSAGENESIRREMLQIDDGNWHSARATWYGGPGGPGPDGMSIYTGSCGYGKDIGSHYVSAFWTQGGYDWGLTNKCGTCYEVMCVDGGTRGKEEQSEFPDSACHESGVRSVVVKITDSCPCHHPNSGNKKWCCGDVIHFDLSYAAFDAIANRGKGVVDLRARAAKCDKVGEIQYHDEDSGDGGNWEGKKGDVKATSLTNGGN